ncbi:hypothetical protein ACH5RR_032017 [Cinchona calisaya]|uniref:Pentatricopeptide repeat-containing protein n=1 Tax=Cinchona calisaya TaxID=153742 RepID=A0ABD2YL49_9GENT
MLEVFLLSDMARCTLVEFKFLEPVHHHKLHTPNSTSKGRKLMTGISLQTIPKGSVDLETRLLKSSASYEPYQKTRVQELVDALHECAVNGLLKEAKAAHGLVLKCGFTNDNVLVLLNHVMHAYSKCLDFRLARSVFNTMSCKNVFSWTVMIEGSINNGLLYDGYKYFWEMQQCGRQLDAFAYAVILQLCIGLDRLDLAEMMHAQIVIKGFASHVFVSTSLLTMYAKLGKVEESLKIFNTMNEHNEVSWNAMISGFTANGHYLEAFNHFLMMIKCGFTPDMYSLISVLKAVGMVGDVAKGKQVHKYVSELNLESNIRVGTALIDMYSRCGALSDAHSVFYQNFSNCWLNMPWNAMIGGYARCKYSQEALQLYVEMCKKNIKSDVYTYCSVFDAIADLKCSRFLREVHGKLLKFGDDLMQLSIDNAIADAYSNCMFLEDARKVFGMMKDRDLLSWTTLVGAYSRYSDWEGALLVFSQMGEEGFLPNQFTLSTVLIACAGLCYLELGEQLHGLIYKTGLDGDSCVHSALIDMYAKCGSIAVARKVFDCISTPDVVSWTAIISGYAHHGLVADALQLFRRMEILEVRPTSVTLLCILFACSHTGMVEEGLEYFWSVKGKYSLEPKMEHYACIIDLLGRVGCLDEAFEFIKAMPVEPDEMVWQTLLAACRIHGNIDLGEIAAKNILSTQPKSSAAYVLLSNMYTETGSFRNGLQLRKMMKEQGVQKEPGYSCISLEGRVHKFYAGDQEHPQKDDIYLKLVELRKMIKAFGYIPDLKYALRGED